MPDETWQQLGDVTRRMLSKLVPALYEVRLDGELASILEQRAAREGCKAEALIAQAVRRYMREAA